MSSAFIAAKNDKSLDMFFFHLATNHLCLKEIMAFLFSDIRYDLCSMLLTEIINEMEFCLKNCDILRPRYHGKCFKLVYNVRVWIFHTQSKKYWNCYVTMPFFSHEASFKFSRVLQTLINCCHEYWFMRMHNLCSRTTLFCCVI